MGQTKAVRCLLLKDRECLVERIPCLVVLLLIAEHDADIVIHLADLKAARCRLLKDREGFVARIQCLVVLALFVEHEANAVVLPGKAEAARCLPEGSRVPCCADAAPHRCCPHCSTPRQSCCRRQQRQGCPVAPSQAPQPCLSRLRSIHATINEEEENAQRVVVEYEEQCRQREALGVPLPSLVGCAVGVPSDALAALRQAVADLAVVNEGVVSCGLCEEDVCESSATVCESCKHVLCRSCAPCIACCVKAERDALPQAPGRSQSPEQPSRAPPQPVVPRLGRRLHLRTHNVPSITHGKGTYLLHRDEPGEGLRCCHAVRIGDAQPTLQLRDFLVVVFCDDIAVQHLLLDVALRNLFLNVFGTGCLVFLNLSLQLRPLRILLIQVVLCPHHSLLSRISSAARRRVRAHVVPRPRGLTRRGGAHCCVLCHTWGCSAWAAGNVSWWMCWPVDGVGPTSATHEP